MERDELPEPKREQWDVDAMWARVRARTIDAPAVPAPRKPPVRWVSVLAAAASLIVIAGSGALLLRARARSSPEDASATPAHYATARGQYATVHLSDSSEVTLAPESRLTISAQFAHGAREITLEGEAVFAVHHDPARPFRVRARDAIVEDIGTRFDLRAYPGDATVMVAVAEGSVALGPSRAGATGAPSVLKSGEVGTIDSVGHVSADRDGRASSYLGWAGGTLSFVNRPLPEVLRTIARWYDLDVRVADARLARRLVTAEFSRQSTGSAMIDALAIAMDATVERNGRVITLRPR